MITQPKQQIIRSEKFPFFFFFFHHTIRVDDDKSNWMDEYKQLDYQPMFDNLDEIE